MDSIRKVVRDYEKLLSDVETKDYYKVDLTNRVNCYVCPDGHITKTKDIDAGVTPMIIKCESCNLFAKSTFFKDVAPDQDPTQEWYRPSLQETIKMRKIPPMLQHVMSGGLCVRQIAKTI